MDVHRFVNALRIMRDIDRDDLQEAGVLDENWGTPEASKRDQILAFLHDPFTEATWMPHANLEKLWVLIESRQPKSDADEAPHEALHLYKGDGALVLRENGNMTVYGTQHPELIAAMDDAPSDINRPASRRVLSPDESPTFGRARLAAQEAAQAAANIPSDETQYPTEGRLK